MCFSARCSIIFAGIWCLLQSIAWAILAFLGLSLYTCDLEVTYDISNPLYALYFIYFFNRECATIPDDLDFQKKIEDLTTPPGFTTPFPLPAWPDKFGPVDLTHDLMLGYFVLSILWAVTSLVIVVAGILHVRIWVAYFPWILVTIANIIIDVTATIIFGTDASETQTPLGLLKLIGVLNISEREEDNPLQPASGSTMIPSLVMALLSSRVVVFWLLNVVQVFCVALAARRLYKDRGKSKDTNLPTYPNHNSTAATENSIIPFGSGNNNAANNKPHDNNVKQPDYEYVAGPITNNKPFSHSYTRNDRNVTSLETSSTTKPFSYTRDDRNVTSLETGSTTKPFSYTRDDRNVTSLETGSTNRPFSYTPEDPTMASLRALSFLKKGPTTSTAIPRANLHSSATEPYYMECLEPNTLPHSPSESAHNAGLPPFAAVSKQQPETPSEQKTKYDGGVWKKAPDSHQIDSNRVPDRSQPSSTDTNRRPASNEEVKPLSRMSSQTSQDRTQDPTWIKGPRLSGSMPPDELRSQLPWSYFGPRNVAVKPKPKATPTVDEGLEKPPVPVPDYTLHFGKSNRPSTSTWSEDEMAAPNVDRNISLPERSRY